MSQVGYDKSWVAEKYNEIRAAVQRFFTEGVVGARVKFVHGQGTGSVTAEQCGITFICLVDAVISLPVAATCEGTWFRFINGALSSGTGLSISPDANDNIYGSGLTAVDNKDLINSGASDTVGDSCIVASDGDNWVVFGTNGTWAKQA